MSPSCDELEVTRGLCRAPELLAGSTDLDTLVRHAAQLSRTLCVQLSEELQTAQDHRSAGTHVEHGPAGGHKSGQQPAGAGHGGCPPHPHGSWGVRMTAHFTDEATEARRAGLSAWDSPPQ